MKFHVAFLELSCVLAGQERREDDRTSAAPRETLLIKHGAPLTGRISVAAAIDPRIMSKRLRSLRNHPNERDPKQQAPVCNLICTYCHRTPPQCPPRAAKLLPRNKKSPDPGGRSHAIVHARFARKRCRPSKYEGLFLSAELLRAWAIIKHYAVRGRGPEWREKWPRRAAVAKGTFGACR